MVLVIDLSQYENTVHVSGPVRLQHLQLLKKNLILKYPDDSCNSIVAQIWLNPLPSLPHAHPIVDNMVNHSCSDFISYCVPDSPSSTSPSPHPTSPLPSPLPSLTSSPPHCPFPPPPPTSFLHLLSSSSSSSSSHLSYTLCNIGLHCCPNQCLPLTYLHCSFSYVHNVQNSVGM